MGTTRASPCLALPRPASNTPLVVALANVVHKAEGLPGSLKLAMKLHYVANIKYPNSVKSLYGVLETFSKLPISVSLGAPAKKVIAENK